LKSETKPEAAEAEESLTKLIVNLPGLSLHPSGSLVRRLLFPGYDLCPAGQ
jgi:hypothetical protein